MMDAEKALALFLQNAGWGEATRSAVAADFSSRRFYRLTREGQEIPSAILMTAAPDQKTKEFAALATLLRGIGIVAPEIYAVDVAAGFVLMEDFGEGKVGSLLEAGHNPALFDAGAATLLAALHKNFLPSQAEGLALPRFDAALLAEQAALFVDFAFPRETRRAATDAERKEFIAAWQESLAPFDKALPCTLLLRDFMPDNAMLLSSPVAKQTLGVIDFQDAGIGPIAYDLASWCEDVRRDGGLARLPAFVAAYHALHPVVDKTLLLQAARVYAAQRHTRILGILVKLGRGAMIPRVTDAVQSLLQDEALAPVRRWAKACGVMGL
jgi:hypothetical protein